MQKKMLKRSKFSVKLHDDTTDNLVKEEKNDNDNNNIEFPEDENETLNINDAYHSEIIEIKIKKINDKWRLEIDKLENEKV